MASGKGLPLGFDSLDGESSRASGVGSQACGVVGFIRFGASLFSYSKSNEDNIWKSFSFWRSGYFAEGTSL